MEELGLLKAVYPLQKEIPEVVMEITRYLEEEHGRITQFISWNFEGIEREPERVAKLLQELHMMLEAHLTAEEVEIYQQIKSFSQCKTLIETLEAQHTAIREAFRELQLTPLGNQERWHDKLRRLGRELVNHFQLAESSLFTKVRDLLPYNERVYLAERARNAQEELYRSAG